MKLDVRITKCKERERGPGGGGLYEIEVDDSELVGMSVRAIQDLFEALAKQKGPANSESPYEDASYYTARCVDDVPLREVLGTDDSRSCTIVVGYEPDLKHIPVSRVGETEDQKKVRDRMEEAQKMADSMVQSFIDKSPLLLTVTVSNAEQAEQILDWMYNSTNSPMKAKLDSVAWDQVGVSPEIMEALRVIKETPLC